LKILLYFNKFRNAFKIAFLRMKYKSRFKSDLIQYFEKGSSFVLKNGGELELGSAIISRKNFSLIADGGRIKIGKGTFFNHNCSITALKEIEIGCGCSFGNNVVVVDHDHNFKKMTGSLFVCSSVIIGDNVWIGANSVILKGTKIGANSVIAAGSVIKEEIPDNTLVYQKRETNMKKIERTQ